MKSVYSSPFRVYLILGLLGLLGLWTAGKLPLSLYPNSTRPTISAGVSYGAMTSDEFLRSYGKAVEADILAIKTDSLTVTKLEADYQRNNVTYEIEFEWGGKPFEARSEVEAIVRRHSATWPEESRDSVWVNYWSRSGGFVAVSFYSSKREPDELFKILDPLITPMLSRIEDANDPALWNPNSKEIMITLKPQAMATLGLFPKNIQYALEKAKIGGQGGAINIDEKSMPISLPNSLKSEEQINNVPVITSSGKSIPLSQVASVKIGPNINSQRIFKTNGNKGLILFAQPKNGGNLKRMSEEMLALVDSIKGQYPNDIEFRVLVDPGYFIRSAIKNVFHEVALAAALAVLVLFLFVGSLKNTATAAIEIPLSMILSFIVMYTTGMNLNLISLGGLALAAGMNVDASVVVMENIFRYMESVKGKLSPSERLNLVYQAVREVTVPVIGSTIASLVVFIPLAFTSALTNAILGDLAKAVVYSHGISAIVALILVPTIRLHLLNRAGGKESIGKAHLDKPIQIMERKYSQLLRSFLASTRKKISALVIVIIALTLCFALIVPRLPREIVGLPDTDWMILGINTQGNTVMGQMESITDRYERELLSDYGSKILYTFVQINRPNRSMIMLRLKDKKEMDLIWKSLQKKYTNTPTIFFWIEPWNPAELPIPNPPNLQISIKGGNAEDRTLVAKDLQREINKADLYQQNWTEPNATNQDEFQLKLNNWQWSLFAAQNPPFSVSDLLDLLRVSTEGRSLNNIAIEGKDLKVTMEYPQNMYQSIEAIKSIPININGQLFPLRAMVNIDRARYLGDTKRIQGQEVQSVFARVDKGEERQAPGLLIQAQALFKKYEQNWKQRLGDLPITIAFEDAQVELTDALKQLTYAISLSLALIFLVLLLQFNSIADALIVIVAVPFGFLGALLSLWFFNSTLSLNSALGIILLNGISVANSIILVDVINHKIADGMTPVEAALWGSRQRLRPILMTSLTTILGMLPVALGMGDGGKILAPLGITVTGGLWVSMLFTLFAVPTLKVMLENSRRSKLQKVNPAETQTLPMSEAEPMESNSWQ